MENKAIGKRIKKLREGRKTSRAVMARALGIKETRIQDIERGKQKVPVDLLTQFAGYFGVDVRFILTGALNAAEDQGTYESGTVAVMLSKKEAALLDNYRQSPGDAQDALIKASAAFAQQPRSKITRSRQ